MIANIDGDVVIVNESITNLVHRYKLLFRHETF